MPNWKKVILKDSIAELNQLTVSGVTSLASPAAPTTLTTSIVNDTINVTFNQSATAGISSYELYASDDGGAYGLISTISPDEFASSMSVIDTTFLNSGTQAYRLYAIKNGVYSSAKTGTRTFSAGTLEVTGMTVIPQLNSFLIKWNPPSANARFATAYNVYKHEHATQGSLAEGSATLVYSGLNTSFDYTISGVTNNNFHQFWITTTVA
tara:strand:+ start:40 stop:666 length:627 start_codon:yes stop_codon:yes gene_type:complete